jgi:uncharacterized protein (TIGR02677 family)
VRDVAALKAGRAERARLERAELQAAWGRLATESPVRVSDFGELEHPTFERLLDLLGRALSSTRDTSGVRRGVTGDGKVELLLREPADSVVAVLRTPRGLFRGPDYIVEVRTAGAATRSRRQDREAAG